MTKLYETISDSVQPASVQPPAVEDDVGAPTPQKEPAASRMAALPSPGRHGDGDDKPKLPQANGKPTPATKPPPATPKAKAKAKANAGANGGENPPVPEDEAKRKGMAELIRKLVLLKTETTSATQAAGDVLQLVATESSWRWANSNFWLDPLRGARKGLEDAKRRNAFWKTWHLEDDFAKKFKTTMTLDAVKKEMDSHHEAMVNAVKKLKAATTKIKTIHATQLGD